MTSTEGICGYCEEAIHPAEYHGATITIIRADGSTDVRPSHEECALREVIGGIGHLLNHEYWCIKMHDPDAGLTYRESAKLAWTHYSEQDPGGLL